MSRVGKLSDIFPTTEIEFRYMVKAVRILIAYRSFLLHVNEKT